MLAMKSALAALLAAFVLIVLPPLLRQDAGPGKPDDVAQVLPEETLAFVELVKAPRLLHDWKDYVGSLTTADGKDKACAFIEEWFAKAIEIVPEKLLKDLKEGLPTIQRMAVALTGPPSGDIPWLFIATSTDPAFLKKLVENDLSLFAAEEKAHRGVKVFAIRKMGELKSDQPVFVAAAGARLLISTRWENLTDALDRAEGRAPGNDLRKNRLYAQLAPAPTDDPALRSFCRWDWEAFLGSISGPGSYRRMTRFHMDMADAVFGFRKIVGTVSETVFKPGRVVSTTRMPVDPSSRLYDALRQPPGPKDLLAHLPKKSVAYAHANLKGGKEVWADVEMFVRRFQEAEKKGQSREEEKDYVAEMDAHLGKSMGFPPRDLAAVVGNELVIAMVEIENLDRSWLALARTTDPVKAKELLETAAKARGKYVATTKDDVTVYKRVKRDTPCFGISGPVIALGGDEATVREALKSKDDAAGAVKRLPKDAASASLVGSFNTARVVDVILKATGEEMPDFLKHLRPDDWSSLLVRTEKEQAIVTTVDGGPGAIAQTALSAFPIVMIAGFGMVRMGPMAVEAVAPPEKERPEPPKMAAAELEKRTSELVVQLRSEDLTVREKASSDLQALGRQAIPLLVAAYKAEKDAEARSRLSNLLVEHKAWDALPELMDRRVDLFFDEFRKAIEEKGDHDRWGGGYADWDGADQEEPWSMEPHVNPYFVSSLKNADVASIPGALKRVAERVAKSDLQAPKRTQFAALFAFNDCGPAHESLLQMRDAATDAESRALFTIALGWSDDPKAKEAVYRSLGSKDLAVRRGAFLAVERMRDPEAVTRLLERTIDSNFETRWNAGYTAGVITSGKLELNAFLPDAEFEAQVKSARNWWDANKATFKLKAAR